MGSGRGFWHNFERALDPRTPGTLLLCILALEQCVQAEFLHDQIVDRGGLEELEHDLRQDLCQHPAEQEQTETLGAGREGLDGFGRDGAGDGCPEIE